MGNHSNRAIVFTSNGVKISSDLGPEYNGIIEGWDDYDFSMFDGGDPLRHYYSDNTGNSITGLHIAFQPYNGETLGFNPGKNGEFGSYTSVALGGIVTQGLDTIYVNSINGNQKARHVDVVLRTIVHELLHESRIVDKKADSQLSLLMDLAENPGEINWDDGLESVRSALEHVIVSVAVAAFAEKNDVEAYLPGGSFGLTGKTISEYKTDLYNALNGSGVPRAATDATIGQPLEISAGSKNVETNVFKILENEKGGVAAYINEQGELGCEPKLSH